MPLYRGILAGRGHVRRSVSRTRTDRHRGVARCVGQRMSGRGWGGVVRTGPEPARHSSRRTAYGRRSIRDGASRRPRSECRQQLYRRAGHLYPARHHDEIEFETDSIRGVALAGEGFSPKIVINLAHVYNSNEEGKRFTIGHELCHILFDRTRARRISHVSGSWAPRGIEKRANAFAAYLLMPRTLIAGNIVYGNRIDSEKLGRLAGILRVNESPLVEHLYNINLIGDVERARLRSSIRSLQ